MYLDRSLSRFLSLSRGLAYSTSRQRATTTRSHDTIVSCHGWRASRSAPRRTASHAAALKCTRCRLFRIGCWTSRSTNLSTVCCWSISPRSSPRLKTPQIPQHRNEVLSSESANSCLRSLRSKLVSTDVHVTRRAGTVYAYKACSKFLF